MSTPEVIVKVQKPETMQQEMEALHDQITRRAYQIYLDRGALAGCDLDDWLTAERELVWKPAIEIVEKNTELMIQVAMAGIEPGDFTVRLTGEHLLIKSERTHSHRDERDVVHVCEFRTGPVFRIIHFPKRVDPATVEVEYRNGLFQLKAALAKQEVARQAA